MIQDTITKEYELDAQGKKLGRFASEIAVFLMGKNLPEFKKNVVANVSVKVSNVSLMDISQKKAKTKKYVSYSGYPGGQKVETVEKVAKDKGYEEILRRAVFGMLPGNKLRSKRMKHLIFINK